MNTTRYLMAAVVGAALAMASTTTNAAPNPQAPDARPPGEADVKATVEANAAPKLGAVPAVRHRTTNVMRALRAEAKSVEGIPYEGRLDRIGDGLVMLSQPIPAGTRKIVSEGRQIPLAQVPVRSTRTVYLTHAIRLDQLRKLEGQPVRATFRLNDRGFFELTEIVRDDRVEPTPAKP